MAGLTRSPTPYSPADIALGLDRPITRRDFLNGVALGAGAAAAGAAGAGEPADLVVVGAGISLAAAFLYRQHAGPCVLLLDALAEPGGHAQRNEFVAHDGRRLIGYGGSEAMDTPSLWSPTLLELVR
jgi:spermidine dehydrogenase